MNPADVAALLEADRELTASEMSTLQQISHSGWKGLTSKNNHPPAYNVASANDFRDCVYLHMNPQDESDMIAADAYHCPRCGRLLKDRRNQAASGILLERKRVQQMWLRVEDASPEDKPGALQSFRRALGLIAP